ncbi:MAG: DsbA family protein [Pseudomonadales bacterium]|nr:DsbA family protein [Pseudomonadales bacterium]
MPILYYIHDPMCSWCWAYAPILTQIRQGLAGQIKIVNVLGGLAADTDQPMSAQMRQQIEGYWRRIEQEVGTVFNFDFWKNADITPLRATYPACRAVIAAGIQGAEAQMIDAIQHAYYLRAMNPSDEDTLLQLADELELDFDQFSLDLNSADVEEALQQQIAFTRALPVQGFPAWVLRVDEQYFPITVDYHSAANSLVRLAQLLKK